MNYEQLTSLFRVEERSTQFVVASLANVLITVGMTVLLVVGLHKGPTGAVVGNFIGTLCVYVVLLVYRRYQLGLQFSRSLLREMNRFGMPLVPSALALWAINFIDRIFIAQYKGQAEVGVYSVAVRISSAIVFLMIAFRLAWPAFAYSIEDDREAKRTYSYVLTYLLFVCSWISVALGVLAPWLVHLLARGPGFARAADAVALLCVRRHRLRRLHGRRDRDRPRAPDAVQLGRVSGVAAIVNIGLNVTLIPPYGMIGAAVSTLAAYLTLFVGMVLNSTPRLPGRLPVASRRDPHRRRRRADGAGSVAARPARGRDPDRARLPGRAATAGLLPARRAPPPPRTLRRRLSRRTT